MYMEAFADPFDVVGDDAFVCTCAIVPDPADVGLKDL